MVRARCEAQRWEAGSQLSIKGGVKKKRGYLRDISRFSHVFRPVRRWLRRAGIYTYVPKPHQACMPTTAAPCKVQGTFLCAHTKSNKWIVVLE